jgi:hypothetical protein
MNYELKFIWQNINSLNIIIHCTLINSLDIIMHCMLIILIPLHVNKFFKYEFDHIAR